MRVSHVSTDIEAIGWSELDAKKGHFPSLLLREWKVRSPADDEGGYEKIWLPQSGVSSGWDVSPEVQGKRKEFKEMTNATGADGQGAFHVNGSVKQAETERGRFALSALGNGEERRESGTEGAREVRKEVLRYVLG